MAENGTKVSKRDVDAKLAEIKEFSDKAASWGILRDGDNAYVLYERSDSGTLDILADLGANAPDAVRTLTGVFLGINLVS